MNTMKTQPAYTENVPLELPKRKKKRIYEVDLLRALPIFLVVLYHLCFDMAELPYIIANYKMFIGEYPTLQALVGFCDGILRNDIISTWLVPLFAGMFLFACGVSTALSRSNLRRSLLLWLWALLVSFGSFILSYYLKMNVFIGWGILHVMAFSVLVYALIELFSRKVLKKEVSPLVCLFIGILIYLFGLLLRAGAFGEAWPVEYLQGTIVDWQAKSPWGFVLSALGYYGNVIDWWPIFPYMGVIFIGMAFGKGIYGERKESRVPVLGQPVFKPLLFLGGHTLWVYVLHQPIIIAVLFVVLSSMGFHL